MRNEWLYLVGRLEREKKDLRWELKIFQSLFILAKFNQNKRYKSAEIARQEEPKEGEKRLLGQMWLSWK